MVSQSQAAYIMALIKERHSDVKDRLEKLLLAIVGTDQNTIDLANSNLLQSLHALKDVIAREHHPTWLTDFLKKCQLYKSSHSKGSGIWLAHLKCIIDNYHDLVHENWGFPDTEDSIFDADKIIEQAARDYKIDALYDKIICCLSALVNSGEIDSFKAIGDLNNIISTLKQSKDQTFLSKVLTWTFTKSLVSNILKEYAKSNNIIGPLIKGYEATASDLDNSIVNVRENIRQRIIEEVKEQMQTDAIQDARVDEIGLLEYKG
ncbi:hypothetical protein GCM10011371_20110 [Novosphingobium marinum]|uniref:Uncharacterized protein n=1 Tax=Novosphingobium marinum TaxID=1514948 RepID=A0A7Z0BVB9_9SPHN|nr:hypothetical protein [Novosphingobium marinum]NYH96123.1 hypothetical protein [Novosphingobium marinum]GGC32664.1 hypothetical protein GCM10011371_20110 [Novosphingobium marinum]